MASSFSHRITKKGAPKDFFNMESGIHLCVPYGPGMYVCIGPFLLYGARLHTQMELDFVTCLPSPLKLTRTPHRTTAAAPRHRPCSEGNQETLIPSHTVFTLPPSNIIMTKTVPAALVACVLLPSACVGFVPPTSRQLHEQTQVSTFNRMPSNMLFMSDSDQDVSSHIII